MSMLVRYKKSGGFLQLVKLLEGFGKEKREKFLDLVEKEDAVWAGALKDKLLSVEKILEWDADTVGNITQNMHEKSLAALMHGLDGEQKEKIFSLMGHSEKRRLEGTISEMSPTPGEIATGRLQLIEETRKMMSGGAIRIEKIAPEMVIEDDIEEHLATATNFESSPYHKKKQDNLDFGMAEHLGGGASAADGQVPADYDVLKRKVINLTKEVNQLKRENQTMSEKLAQIKKIA